MKRNRKTSLQHYAIHLIIRTFVPMFCCAIVIGSYLISTIRKNLNAGYEQSLTLFSGQLESRLESIDQYALGLLIDTSLNGLKEEKGSGEYQHTLTNLSSSMQNNILVKSGIQDVIYCFVPSTSDVVGYRNKNTVSMEQNLKIEEWIRTAEGHSWQLTEIGDVTYLTIVRYGKYFNIAVLLDTDQIVNLWNEGNSQQTILEISSQESEKKGYVRISEPFLTDTIHMNLYVQKGRFVKGLSAAVGLMLLLFGFVLNAVLLYFRKMQEMQKTEYELKLENEKMKLENLQIQINPHLLLNSLNTIYGLAELEDYRNIQTFSMNMVSYFRYSLQDITHLVTLEEEMKFTESYTKIQQIRYPDQFYLLFDIDESLFGEMIPPLLLQNFVENSVKYAYDGTHLTEILVLVRKNQDKLRISVTDDGCGMDQEVLDSLNEGQPLVKEGKTHIGIYNCRNRLRLFYGEDVSFGIISAPGEGTSVWMEIPCKRDAEA